MMAKISILSLFLTGCAGWDMNPMPQNVRETTNYACAIADSYTTEQGLDRGAQETNPFGKNETIRWPFKILVNYFINMLDRNATHGLAWGGAGIQCAAAIHNNGVAR